MNTDFAGCKQDKQDGKCMIGIIGSGFISRGLIVLLEQSEDLDVSKVLTRTRIENRHDFPWKDLLTNSAEELIGNADVIVECSGDILNSTEVMDAAMDASKPIVTMNAEIHVTTGSYLAKKGFITEAEGDQPGCIAALKEDAVQMGFKPMVYGNIKGFLNHNPTLEDMEYWAKKQGNSLEKVTSFTDGTKVQIEQALVANGLGAGIVKPGLVGIPTDDIKEGAKVLAEAARSCGYPISDYVLSSKMPPGVFITGENDERVKGHLSYYKMGEGPYYTLFRNYHLCHFEVAKTIRRVMDGGGVLLNNSVNPAISVAAIAKRAMHPGYLIKRGVGSFDMRGIAVNIKDSEDHIPIGLLENAVVNRQIEAGRQITFEDVRVPESFALEAWFKGL